MGNNNSSPKSSTSTQKPSTFGPDGGHVVSVTGIYHEHSWEAGLQDEWSSDMTREELEKQLNLVGIKAAVETTEETAPAYTPPDRKREDERHKKVEAEIYERGTVECPICFLNYPSNMNMSRCCDQPICTECFVQIKRTDPTPTHLVSEPVACPYCVEPQFGIIYKAPDPVFQRTPAGAPVFGDDADLRLIASSSSAGPASAFSIRTSGSRRKSLSADAPEVVTTDIIYPNWQVKLEAARATAARRANRRIVFRRVGDRLIPVGITSSRDVAAAAMAAEQGLLNQNQTPAQPEAGTREGRRVRRSRGESAGFLGNLGLTGADLEELMIMEAMRLSLLDQERSTNPSGSTSNPTATPSPTITLPSASPSLAPPLLPSATITASLPTQRSPTPLSTSSRSSSSSPSQPYMPLNDNDSRSLLGPSTQESADFARRESSLTSASTDITRRSSSLNQSL